MATQLRTPYIFNPIDENAQRFSCSLVDLPLIFPHEMPNKIASGKKNQKKSSNALNVVLYNSSPNVHSVCWQTLCSRTTEKPQACCCLTTN